MDASIALRTDCDGDGKATTSTRNGLRASVLLLATSLAFSRRSCISPSAEERIRARCLLGVGF